MSACNKFREYLSKNIDELPHNISWVAQNILQTFDELHQSNRENTGANCSAKKKEKELLCKHCGISVHPGQLECFTCYGAGCGGSV